MWLQIPTMVGSYVSATGARDIHFFVWLLEHHGYLCPSQASQLSSDPEMARHPRPTPFGYHLPPRPISFRPSRHLLSNISLLAAQTTAMIARRNISRKKRKTYAKGANINRGAHEGHNRIWQHYFADNAVYGHKAFRRRFRMRK